MVETGVAAPFIMVNRLRPLSRAKPEQKLKFSCFIHFIFIIILLFLGLINRIKAINDDIKLTMLLSNQTILILVKIVN